MEAKLPTLSCLGLAGTGAGTWAIASAHGTGPPLVPPVGPPAWLTFSLAVGSKALPLASLGLGLSGLAPVSSPSLLLAAAGSGASHLWPQRTRLNYIVPPAAVGGAGHWGVAQGATPSQSLRPASQAL